MTVLDLPVVKEPVEKGVYETVEAMFSPLELAAEYKLHVDVDPAVVYDGSLSVKAELLYFEPGLGEWVAHGDFTAVLTPPGGGNELVEQRNLWGIWHGSREGADKNNGQKRRIVFDLLNGKRVKARLTMPTAFSCTVSIESTRHHEAMKGSLVVQVDEKGQPILDKDGKPERRADVGVELELHHSIALIENQDASADGAITASTGSWTVTANNTVVVMASSNANATTDHSFAVSGTIGSGFTSRVRSKYTDESTASGVAEGFTAQRHAGGTGVITLTRSGAANNGIMFSCTECTGVEATFSGAVGTISCAGFGALVDQVVTMPIVPRSTGGYIFASSSDFQLRGDYTAGSGETLDAILAGSNCDLGTWHSTGTTTKGTLYTTDEGSTLADRDWHLAALEICPAQTAALTGTITASITEADIVSGGKTEIVTLTDGVWAPALDLVFVGKQSGGFAGTTSAQTINFALRDGVDTVPAAGDLVIISYFIASPAATDRSLAIRNTGATDYDIMGSELFQNDSTSANQRTASRVMPGTPETQFVLTETVGGGTGAITDAGSYTVHVFRYPDGTPMDVTVVTAGAANSGTPNPGSITPSTAGAFIYIAGGAAAANGIAMRATYLAAVATNQAADNNDSSLLAGFLPWVSGAYDGAAFTNPPAGTTADSWTCITAAIRPGARFDSTRQTSIDNADSAQAEGTGWDAVVKAGAAVSEVVRTSATVKTRTLAAFATYNITAQETITRIIKASELAWGLDDITPSSNTYTIDTSGAAATQPTMTRWGGIPILRNIMRPGSIFGRTWADGRRYAQQTLLNDDARAAVRPRAAEPGRRLCAGGLRATLARVRGRAVQRTGRPAPSPVGRDPAHAS